MRAPRNGSIPVYISVCAPRARKGAPDVYNKFGFDCYLCECAHARHVCVCVCARVRHGKNELSALILLNICTLCVPPQLCVYYASIMLDGGGVFFSFVYIWVDGCVGHARTPVRAIVPNVAIESQGRRRQVRECRHNFVAPHSITQCLRRACAIVRRRRRPRQ